mmetsp:Transcript_20344/g.63080  ORF Transcript_20344/g.63080 Transcript_20344/m.63080 type:complete len:261 (+) Transcript_20344:37-819(+)
MARRRGCFVRVDAFRAVVVVSVCLDVARHLRDHAAGRGEAHAHQPALLAVPDAHLAHPLGRNHRLRDIRVVESVLGREDLEGGILAVQGCVARERGFDPLPRRHAAASVAQALAQVEPAVRVRGGLGRADGRASVAACAALPRPRLGVSVGQHEAHRLARHGHGVGGEHGPRRVVDVLDPRLQHVHHVAREARRQGARSAVGLHEVGLVELRAFVDGLEGVPGQLLDIPRTVALNGAVALMQRAGAVAVTGEVRAGADPI